jgi:hypothetical protein
MIASILQLWPRASLANQDKVGGHNCKIDAIMVVLVVLLFRTGPTAE